MYGPTNDAAASPIPMMSAPASHLHQLSVDGPENGIQVDGRVGTSSGSQLNADRSIVGLESSQL